MKTLEDWNGSGKPSTLYLSAGDEIDVHLWDYFLGVVPPIFPFIRQWDAFLMGEAIDSNPQGEPMYMAFSTTGDGRYTYHGLRTRRELESLL